MLIYISDRWEPVYSRQATDNFINMVEGVYKTSKKIEIIDLIFCSLSPSLNEMSRRQLGSHYSTVQVSRQAIVNFHH